MHRVPIEGVAVVVPVRDEEALLGRALDGIRDASSALMRERGDRIRICSVVVLDSCTDGSARIALDSGAAVVGVRAGDVGLARASGVRTCLELLADLPSGSVWIANTDADSSVPADWLIRQLDLADGGWDVVLGRVQPDLADLPEALRNTSAAHVTTTAEPVYGANLGVRASSYLRAGGFRPARVHEDQRLVAALRRTGARVTASIATPVLTSSRLDGRTPGGYAGFLRDMMPGA